MNLFKENVGGILRIIVTSAMEKFMEIGPHQDMTVSEHIRIGSN